MHMALRLTVGEVTGECFQDDSYREVRKAELGRRKGDL
jgi:hypothetical protein